MHIFVRILYIIHTIYS